MIRGSLELKYESVRLSDGNNDEMVLYIDGVRQERVGNGRDRVVYGVSGTELVAKVDDNHANQAGKEWKAFRVIAKTEHKKHVARLYKPVTVKVSGHPRLETAQVTFQQRVRGKLMCDIGDREIDHECDKITSLFSDKFNTNDLHGRNVMYDERKKKVLIVDLGL